jgi:hypothetical protein
MAPPVPGAHSPCPPSLRRPAGPRRRGAGPRGRPMLPSMRLCWPVTIHPGSAGSRGAFPLMPSRRAPGRPAGRVDPRAVTAAVPAEDVLPALHQGVAGLGAVHRSSKASSARGPIQAGKAASSSPHSPRCGGGRPPRRAPHPCGERPHPLRVGAHAGDAVPQARPPGVLGVADACPEAAVPGEDGELLGRAWVAGGDMRQEYRVGPAVGAGLPPSLWAREWQMPRNDGCPERPRGARADVT